MTIADLEKAVEAVDTARALAKGRSHLSHLHHGVTAAKRDAWQTAFEWRDVLADYEQGCDCKKCSATQAEHEAGMRLIERLK